MKSFILLFAMLTIGNCSKSDATCIGKINKVWIYDYFSSEGYTVGGAFRKFEELEKSNTKKIELSSQDVDTLSRILHSAKMKNSFFGKLGMNVFFASAITNDDKVLRIAILTTMIIDYTDSNSGYKFYVIENQEHQKWISVFKNRIKPD